MSANDKANQFTDGMKQEYDRIAEGMKEGGPDSSHQRQGENTEGLLNRYGPGGSAFSTTDNVSHGASNLLDSAKQATGLGQSKTEQAGQSVVDGAKSFGQGAKDEMNAISSGPSSGATTGESSATGFGQSTTEQAGQNVADGARSFGQGAKDEFNAATSSGPSSGATTGESLLESVKSATGFGQTTTEQAGQQAADGARSFGQGAKDELNALTSGLNSGTAGTTTGGGHTTADSLVNQAADSQRLV